MLDSFVYRLIELETLVTVYGFHDDTMILRKTCHMNMQMYQSATGRVQMEWSTAPVSGEECVHRDDIVS